jgi:hypothetical protein
MSRGRWLGLTVAIAVMGSLAMWRLIVPNAREIPKLLRVVPEDELPLVMAALDTDLPLTLRSIDQMRNPLLRKHFPSVTFYRILAKLDAEGSYKLYRPYWIAVDIGAKLSLFSSHADRVNRLFRYIPVSGANRTEIESILDVIYILNLPVVIVEQHWSEFKRTESGWEVRRTLEDRSYYEVCLDPLGNVRSFKLRRDRPSN